MRVGALSLFRAAVFPPVGTGNRTSTRSVTPEITPLIQEAALRPFFFDRLDEGQRIGWRMSQYLETAQTGRTNWRQFFSWPSTKQTRKDLFSYMVIGLLKTVLDTSDPDKASLRNFSGIRWNDQQLTDLAYYLGLQKSRVIDILDFAHERSDLLNSHNVKPLTLQHTEQIHQAGSGFYRRLNRLSDIAGGSNGHSSNGPSHTVRPAVEELPARLL